jgi:hypothetical protein
MWGVKIYLQRPNYGAKSRSILSRHRQVEYRNMVSIFHAINMSCSLERWPWFAGSMDATF